MEKLVQPDDLLELDIRACIFGWDPNERYTLMCSVEIAAGVPEQVQRLLMTAKNLIVYSCFHYPFNLVAAQTAFSALELAVRLRSDAEGITDKVRGLHGAMQRAINEKWIADDETLCHPMQRQRVFSPEVGLTYLDIPPAEKFVEILGKVFPKYRNTLAHGSSIMDNLGASMVLDVNRVINQIFYKAPLARVVA